MHFYGINAVDICGEVVEQELPYAVTGTAESFGRGMVLADFDFGVR